MDKRRWFELRLTMANGSVVPLGSITTYAEAVALVHAYVAAGRAIRVELFQWRRKRYELLDAFGRSESPLPENAGDQC